MKNIIITGASKGIGRVIAKSLRKKISYYKYWYCWKIK